MPKIDIARALGIDAKTLDKHFPDELSVGIAKRNAEMFEAMFKSGKGGNVAAQKAWLARQDIEPPSAPTPKDDKPEALGKKERADRDALTAERGNSWQELVKH